MISIDPLRNTVVRLLDMIAAARFQESMMHPFDNGNDKAYGVDSFGDGEHGVRFKISLGSTAGYRLVVLWSSEDRIGP